MLERVKFRKYEDTEKPKNVYSIRLNADEIKELEKAQRILNQPKQSTSLKQLALIGLDVLQRKEMILPLKIISSNFRKNGRYTGLDVFSSKDLDDL